MCGRVSLGKTMGSRFTHLKITKSVRWRDLIFHCLLHMHPVSQHRLPSVIKLEMTTGKEGGFLGTLRVGPRTLTCET